MRATSRRALTVSFPTCEKLCAEPACAPRHAEHSPYAYSNWMLTLVNAITSFAPLASNNVTYFFGSR